MKKQQGFTLIELMMVVAIIGSQDAIAIPAYQDHSILSQVSDLLCLSGGVKAAVTEFYQDQGTFPADNTTAGIEAAVNITGKYVTGVAVAAGVITVTYGRDADAKIAGAALTMTPLDNAGSVSWTCASAPRLQNKWLPAACRP